MKYVNDANLQNARTVTKEFDQAIESLDWCVRMTIDGIKQKLNWPWYGFISRDQLVLNLAWIFNHVIDPMLAERENFDFRDYWDDQLLEDSLNGFDNYDDQIHYRHHYNFQSTDGFRLGEVYFY